MLYISTTIYMSITMGFSLTMWLGTMIYSLYNFKDKYLSMFFPHQAPLFLSFLLVFVEIASMLSSPLSLGVSLTSNLTAGHLMLGMGGGFIYNFLINKSIMFFLFFFFWSNSFSTFFMSSLPLYKKEYNS